MIDKNHGGVEKLGLRDSVLTGSARSVTRRLWRVILAGGLGVVALMMMVWYAMYAIQATRAYVGGESIWSKAQKSAVLHLTNYAYTGEASELQKYHRAMATTLAIRDARLELERPEYSFQIVHDAFVRGGIAEEDVPSLANMFRVFGDVGFMASAISIWREADKHIDLLRATAEEIEAVRTQGEFGSEVLNAHLSRIARIDAQLTPLEEKFSETLAVGSRLVWQVAWLLVLSVALLLVVGGGWFSARFATELSGRIRLLCEGAEKIAAGDLGYQIPVQFDDELGLLAQRFNEMVVCRREAEQALQHEQSFLEGTLENLSEAVISCGADGRLEIFNRAARKIHGLPEKSLTPEKWAGVYGDLFESDGRTPLAPASDPLYRAMQGERVADYEVVISLYDGARYVVLASGQPLSTDSGERLGAVVTLHDITEKRRADRQLAERAEALEQANRDLEKSNKELRRLYHAEAASEAKSRFLATMSHEIRTPLHGIIGLLELFESDSLSPQQQRNLASLRESSSVLKHLIDDVLDFAKIEADRIDLESEPTPIQDLTESACVTLQHLAEQRAVELRKHIESDVPTVVIGDSGRLRQILLNLISNAIKFTEAGGQVSVSLAVVRNSEEQPMLRYEVIDTGIGMSPQARDGVFESFVQADSSTTRRFGGTGLGLAISKALVELMGGRIGCSSEYGHGSTFWFELPLQLPTLDAQKQPIAAPDSIATERFPPGDPARILIAEDHPVNQQVIQQQLSRYNCECTIVADGEQALEELEAQKFDMLITDIQMPRLGGYDLVRRWREFEVENALPPLVIIGLSANADKEGLEQCRKVGMNDAQSKPFTLAKLDHCLRLWLADKCMG